MTTPLRSEIVYAPMFGDAPVPRHLRRRATITISLTSSPACSRAGIGTMAPCPLLRLKLNVYRFRVSIAVCPNNEFGFGRSNRKFDTCRSRHSLNGD